MEGQDGVRLAVPPSEWRMGADGDFGPATDLGRVRDHRPGLKPGATAFSVAPAFRRGREVALALETRVDSVSAK